MNEPCPKCGHDPRLHQHGKCGATECPCYTPPPARPAPAVLAGKPETRQ